MHRKLTRLMSDSCKQLAKKITSWKWGQIDYKSKRKVFNQQFEYSKWNKHEHLKCWVNGISEPKKKIEWNSQRVLFEYSFPVCLGKHLIVCHTEVAGNLINSQIIVQQPNKSERDQWILSLPFLTCSNIFPYKSEPHVVVVMLFIFIPFTLKSAYVMPCKFYNTKMNTNTRTHSQTLAWVRSQAVRESIECVYCSISFYNWLGFICEWWFHTSCHKIWHLESQCTSCCVKNKISRWICTCWWWYTRSPNVSHCTARSFLGRQYHTHAYIWNAQSSHIPIHKITPMCNNVHTVYSNVNILNLEDDFSNCISFHFTSCCMY